MQPSRRIGGPWRHGTPTTASSEYPWDTRYPESSNGRSSARRDVITRELLTKRANALAPSLAGAGGTEVAHAAWLHREGRLADARDAMVGAPLDAGVFAGRVARSALLFRQGDSRAATDLLRATMNRLIAAQRPLREAPLSGVDADVAAIRTVVFRPLGDLSVYCSQHWNAFTFPGSMPEFVVLNPGVIVTLADATTSVRAVHHGMPDLPNAVYLDKEDLARLDRIIASIGGTERREPTQIMETPNQPIGMSRNLVNFWNTLFPTRHGHWGGWVLESYPTVTRVEFLDEAHTRATAAVTIGYSGCAVVIEKRDASGWPSAGRAAGVGRLIRPAAFPSDERRPRAMLARVTQPWRHTAAGPGLRQTPQRRGH